MTDESIYRLTESFLAGGAVGGTLGVTTAPFTTETNLTQTLNYGKPRKTLSPDGSTGCRTTTSDWSIRR